MNFIGLGKAMRYVVKGAEVIGAVGTLYDLFDAPRKSREEVRFIEERVDKEVNYFMERKLGTVVDAKIDAKIEAKLKEHDAAIVDELNSKLDAVLAAQEMRKKKGNGNSTNNNGQQ